MVGTLDLFGPPAGPAPVLRVYSLRKGAEKPPADAVRVDRETQWGNIYAMRPTGPEWQERKRVCELHRRRMLEWRDAHPERFAEWIAPLHGKSLVCWCAPKLCHAETLLSLANDVWACPWPRIDTDTYRGIDGSEVYRKIESGEKPRKGRAW